MTATTFESVQPPPVPPMLKRIGAASSALWRLMHDHGRLDQVLLLAQAVNAGAISRAVVALSKDEEGCRFLTEQPRIDRKHVDFDALRKLPEGTLGREYTRFLDDNGITPDAFEALPDVGDERSAVVMLRLRQTHDLWHVLTGYAPDVHGELLLQAFTYGQVHAPSALILMIAGSLRWAKFGPTHIAEMRHAYQRGKATRFLPTVWWENFWEKPVSELRTMFDCPR
jgi:ubiquinone biosynthesis protein COQ4